MCWICDKLDTTIYTQPGCFTPVGCKSTMQYQCTSDLSNSSPLPLPLRCPSQAKAPCWLVQTALRNFLHPLYKFKRTVPPSPPLQYKVRCSIVKIVSRNFLHTYYKIPVIFLPHSQCSSPRLENRIQEERLHTTNRVT